LVGGPVSELSVIPEKRTRVQWQITLDFTSYTTNDVSAVSTVYFFDIETPHHSSFGGLFHRQNTNNIAHSDQIGSDHITPKSSDIHRQNDDNDDGLSHSAMMICPSMLRILRICSLPPCSSCIGALGTLQSPQTASAVPSTTKFVSLWRGQ